MARIPACFIVEQETDEAVLSQTGLATTQFYATLAKFRIDNPEKSYKVATGVCDTALVDNVIRITFHRKVSV